MTDVHFIIIALIAVTIALVLEFNVIGRVLNFISKIINKGDKNG